jgi:hypothetical protein
MSSELTSASFQTIPAGFYGTAISTQIWDNTAHCGGHISVHGPDGETIQAVASLHFV